MRVNQLTNSSSTCVTIDEVYGERPGPCAEAVAQTNQPDSKESSTSRDYFEDLLVHVIVTDMY